MATEYPIEELRKLIHHEPDTGKLFWKHRDVSMFSHTQMPFHHYYLWNKKYANKEIGNHTDRGYNRISLFNRKYPAHRVMWALYYGEWPKDQIDHINGIRNDNRICNLREVTNQENAKNMRLVKRNTTGHAGVTKVGKFWRARVCVDYKDIHLGIFTNLEDAVAARKAAEIQYGFHENHGRDLTTNTNQV